MNIWASLKLFVEKGECFHSFLLVMVLKVMSGPEVSLADTWILCIWFLSPIVDGLPLTSSSPGWCSILQSYFMYTWNNSTNHRKTRRRWLCAGTHFDSWLSSHWQGVMIFQTFELFYERELGGGSPSNSTFSSLPFLCSSKGLKQKWKFFPPFGGSL